MADHSKVSKLRLTRAVAQTKVRAAARDTSRLRWSTHILERMQERDIDDTEVLRVLRIGEVEEDPVEGSKPNEWKVKITHKLSTGRVAAVVAVLMEDGRLRLVTTEWEDKR